VIAGALPLTCDNHRKAQDELRQFPFHPDDAAWLIKPWFRLCLPHPAARLSLLSACKKAHTLTQLNCMIGKIWLIRILMEAIRNRSIESIPVKPR
jgi:hypothetical protein